jgi:c-di-AMP phosphodiesterase-like protein
MKNCLKKRLINYLLYGLEIVFILLSGISIYKGYMPELILFLISALIILGIIIDKRN